MDQNLSNIFFKTIDRLSRYYT